jgi:DNA-binding MarR family transcriptional regulator
VEVEDRLQEYFATLRRFSHILINRFTHNGSDVTSQLRLSQMKALSAFKDDGPLLMSQLANNIGAKLPNMTTMVDGLISEGYAERKRDESDRRKVFVSLTPKGKKLQAQFLANRRKTAQAVFAKLSEKDKNELLSSLDTVCKIMEKSLGTSESH